MNKIKQKTYISIAVVLLVLLIDQVVKIYIKTNFILGEEISFASWCRIHFVENEGMAFGMELGGSYGKLVLTIFRIIALGGIVYLLRQLIRRPETSVGLVVCMSLILAGAAGNIIDSIFYGVLFSDSMGKVATWLPAEGGYAPLLYGKVVDMLYFPIYDGFLPHWLPMWGGNYFMFFRPVFNVADSAISLGVFFLLLFQRSFFGTFDERKQQQTAADTVAATTPADVLAHNDTATDFVNDAKTDQHP